jgi:hypothetical protein
VVTVASVGSQSFPTCLFNVSGITDSLAFPKSLVFGMFPQPGHRPGQVTHNPVFQAVVPRESDWLAGYEGLYW